MPKTFKDLMSELATDTSENAKYSADDIQDVINEVSSKDTRIQELQQALEKANKDHEDLKSRIVEKLFASKDGKPDQNDQGNDEEEEEKTVTFDDLILPDYRNRN